MVLIFIIFLFIFHLNLFLYLLTSMILFVNLCSLVNDRILIFCNLVRVFIFNFFIFIYIDLLNSFSMKYCLLHLIECI